MYIKYVCIKILDQDYKIYFIFWPTFSYNYKIKYIPICYERQRKSLYFI